MFDSMLKRSRHNRILAKELDFSFDPEGGQRIRLPNSIFEPARLHGDPELAIHLEMPLAAADLIIRELESLCRQQKESAEIKIGGTYLQLKITGEHISAICSAGLLSRQIRHLKVENVKGVVNEYKLKRQNYAPDGMYQLDKKAGQ